MAATSAIDFERGILGCVLWDGKNWPLVESLLRKDHFELDSHQQIFAAFRALSEAGRAIDDATTVEQLGGFERAGAVGGMAYIASLSEGMVRLREESIRTYADRIRAAWRARAMARLGEEMSVRAQDEGSDGLAGIQDRMDAILSDSDTQDATVGGCADGVLDRWEKEHSLVSSPAITFGIPSLDEACGGMLPGHQVVIGARSGVGKTRFLIGATAAVCGCGQSAQMNLIEPTRDEFMRGLATFVAGLRASVGSEPWSAGREEKDRFYAAMDLVRKWNLTIYDKANMSLDEIVGRGRVAIHKGCRMIGVDYLQRVYIPSQEKGEQIRLKVARASMALANLVKDTGCTSLVLSQLKRTESMGIPSMQDLRETGQIENDAHLILLLHRDYQAEKGIFLDSGAYVIPKRRFGPPANRRARFDYQAATWEDGEPQAQPAYWGRD